MALPPSVAMRPIGLAIFPVAAMGLLASIYHLGHPLSAWKSLFNLGGSRLSLEVLLTLMFILAALVYSYTWWGNKTEHRFAIGAVTSLLGLAAVASSAVIYLIPTQPAWNSGWIPVSFLGTTLLLGGVASATVSSLQGSRDITRYFLIGGITGSLMLLTSGIWMIASLARSAANDFAASQLQGALHLIFSGYPVWFGLHLFLSGVLPLAFAAALWHRESAGFAGGYSLRLLVFLGVLLGTVIGRRLMYLLGTSIPQF
jgi:anaerobic dimethyl sulfoxide reductase subunit C (anchor subunit)